MVRLTDRPKLFLTLLCLPVAAAAHHSNAEWDPNVKREFEGEVVNVVWRNPHVRFSLKVRTDDGGEETWNLNGNSVSHLVRQGVEGAPIQVGDTVRAIGSPSTRRPRNMNPEAQPATPMGFSVARWENERTLVVETTRVSFPWYNTAGVPQSEDVAIVERFILSADELRLAHEIMVTDPATFTTPARRTSEWMAVPGIEVRPFELDCDYNPWVVTE